MHSHSTVVHIATISSICYAKYEIVLYFRRGSAISFHYFICFYRISDDIFVGGCSWKRYPAVEFCSKIKLRLKRVKSNESTHYVCV